MRRCKRLPLRGGNRNNGGNAGLSALNLNNERSNRNSNIGCRPALESISRSFAVTAAHPANSLKRALDPRPSAETVTGGARVVAIATFLRCQLKGTQLKTYRGLFDRLIQFDALEAAYIKARRGKRHKGEVLAFEANLEGEIIQLQNELVWGEYRTGPYYSFYVHEPKKRLVAALPFRDRVVQHALVAQLEPIWEQRFIRHSYACRPGKGMHAGADVAQRWLREVERRHGRAYVLKADVSKYFQSVDPGVLYGLIRRRVACPRTLTLCREILDSWSPGLPIGNLTSQLWANVYLHELDQFVKQQLREPMYARYMDDFVIVHRDKQHLHDLRRRISGWLHRTLHLTLNNKTQVFPVSHRRGRALDFLGYRTWTTYRRLRPDSVKRMRKRLRYMQGQYARGEIGFSDVRQRIASWDGHAARANSHAIRSKLFYEHPFTRGEPWAKK